MYFSSKHIDCFFFNDEEKIDGKQQFERQAKSFEVRIAERLEGNSEYDITERVIKTVLQSA